MSFQIIVIEILAADIYQEGQKRVITLEDDSPAAVERMLDYLYTFEFEWSQDPSMFDSLPSEAKLKVVSDILAVYVLADKYDISGLREYCRSIYKTAVPVFWSLELEGMLFISIYMLSSRWYFSCISTMETR